MPTAWKTNFLAASWLAAALAGAEPQQPTTSLTSEVAQLSHPTYPKGHDEQHLAKLVIPRQVDIQVPGIQNTPLPLPIPVEVEVAVETNAPAAQTDTGAPVPDAQETKAPAETKEPAVETEPAGPAETAAPGPDTQQPEIPPETVEPPVETDAPPLQTNEPPVATADPPLETVEPPVETNDPPVETVAPVPDPQETKAPAETEAPADPAETAAPIPDTKAPDGPAETEAPPAETNEPPAETVEPPAETIIEPPAQTNEPPVKTQEPEVPPETNAPPPPAETSEPPAETEQSPPPPPPPTVAPETPEQTAGPEEPKTSDAPVVPPVPVPDTPEEPDKPEKPEEPEKPDEPEEPEKPDGPVIPIPIPVPNLPDLPDIPGLPKPPKPDTPSPPKPDDPNPPKPDDPKPPTNPEDPEKPGNPEDPKDPSVPVPPVTPDDPEDPEDPKDPQDPDVPVPPENPDEPDNCEEQDPPPCTETVSFYSAHETYTSTVYITCPAPVDCPAKETPTITTSIYPEESIIWGTVPEYNEAMPTGTDDIDDETNKYFQQFFDDENISINDALHPDVKCEEKSNDDVPRDCFMDIYSKFCREVFEEEGKELNKNLTSADIDSGSPEKRVSLNMRRQLIRERAEACEGWVFEYNWSGANGDCKLPCGDSMYAFGDECFDSEDTYLQGTIDVGCGRYKYTARPTTTEAPIVITALPTLTDLPGPITTPDGSSCAETATNTQCALGGGGRGPACVENTYCASWVSTQPTEAPAPPEEVITPLEEGPVFCKNPDGDHRDVNPGSQRTLADHFCEADLLDTSIIKVEPGMEPFSSTKQDNHGVNYYYEVKWVDGCKTTVDGQDPSFPLGGRDPSCQDLFVRAFKNCDNGGIGGYVDAGCVRYTFLGAQD